MAKEVYLKNTVATAEGTFGPEDPPGTFGLSHKELSELVAKGAAEWFDTIPAAPKDPKGDEGKDTTPPAAPSKKAATAKKTARKKTGRRASRRQQSGSK